MSDVQNQSADAWRQLKTEWSQVQEQWRDCTTDFFARHHWEPLASETEAYLQALESLMETLRAAQEVAGV